MMTAALFSSSPNKAISPRETQESDVFDIDLARLQYGFVDSAKLLSRGAKLGAPE